MNSKGMCLFTVLFLLLNSTFINGQSKVETHQPLLQNSNQRVAVDTNNTAKIDGVPVLQVPESQIEKEKIVELLAQVDLSFQDIISANTTEGNIQENIEKLKQLLQNDRATEDQELEFVVHTMLGNLYLRLSKRSNTNSLLEQAKKHIDAAIAIFEGQPKYKTDLVDAYTGRLAVLYQKGKYEKAISLNKYLIEHFQDIGYGPYKNWFASRQVQVLYNLTLTESLESTEKREIVDYLKETAQKYDNEVGIAAQVSLLGHFAQRQKTEKAKALFDSIKDGMASLHNSAFEEEYIEHARGYIDRMEYHKRSNKHVTQRDTLFYEIQPQMVEQAEVTKIKMQGATEYRVSVRLKEEYHLKYAELTGDNIGNFLGIKYNGEVISQSMPTIQARISSGRFSLGPYGSEKKANKIIKKISHKGD